MNLSSTRFALHAFVGAPVLIALILLGTFVEAAPRKTDLERENLKGPVKAVMIEIAKISGEAGALQERPRIPWMSIAYDRSGNKIEEHQLYSDPLLNFKSIFTYDAQGIPKEGAEYDNKGLLEFKWSYTFDAQQNKLEENRFYAQKEGLFSKSSYLYDNRGNLIEETRFHAESTNDFKWIYTYDQAGNKREEAFYVVHAKGLSNGEPSTLDTKTVFRYDAKGNITEEIRFDPSGSVRSKKLYSYQFDQTGNWIQQTSREESSSGKPSAVPTEVTYRSITYY